MRNLPRDLLSSWLAVLLASSAACTKASFVPVPGGAGGAGGSGISGGAGDSGTVDGGAGAGDSGAAVDSGPGPDVTLTCPATPLACSASTAGICDPVCQTGACNWCNQKCTYALAGATAQPTCAATGKQTVFQPCGVNSSGSASQNDNCLPGSICLQPISGTNSWYCFSLCTSTADCIGAVDCGQRYLFPQGPQVYVCDPPYDECGPNSQCCDPFAAPGTSPCASNQFCLLASPDPITNHSRTVCEFSYGGGQNGSFCSSPHDCMTANTCVNGFCHRVCNDANPCPTGGRTCLTTWSIEYGYCPDY
jgi:hypothetical protein